jgi:hypothetical protein
VCTKLVAVVAAHIVDGTNVTRCRD